MADTTLKCEKGGERIKVSSSPSPLLPPALLADQTSGFVIASPVPDSRP